MIVIGIVMKDKLSHSNCYFNEEEKPSDPENPVTSGNMAEDVPAAPGNRKSKTWCSYMEKGFRVSREMMDKEKGPVDQEN